MADVRPFRALRYAAERGTNLAPVLAPPYDIISAEEQQALYDRDPHNVIRLEYGMQSAADTPEDNRYTRARAALAAWQAEGTLVTEDVPAFYPQQQRFAWGGRAFTRTGLYAAVRLQPFDAGEVLPHELTLKGPKEDRLQLMRACQASFSPVLALYDGRDGGIGERLRCAMREAPLAEARNHGFDESVWRLGDPRTCDELAQDFRGRPLLIADGHHRYETLLAVRDRLRAEYPDAPDTAAFNYAFMLLIDLNDPGLLVLPTHRLLLLTPAMQAAFSPVVEDQFRTEPLALTHPDQVADILARHAGEHAFVWYAGGKYLLLTVPKSAGATLPALDVVVAQEALVTPLLAHDPDGQATLERNVRYTHDTADAIARVDRGEAQAAVLLNSTPVAEVLTLARHGIRVPQKSTYFYPKANTGMIMHHLAPEVSVG